jgi:hypothetical protein
MRRRSVETGAPNSPANRRVANVTQGVLDRRRCARPSQEQALGRLLASGAHGMISNHGAGQVTINALVISIVRQCMLKVSERGGSRYVRPKATARHLDSAGKTRFLREG